jgi:UDP-N-acetylglucosamine--N-acetylmuramyl-(pentapeptide) pyrophosphoryl-undecaprenol N-acetylglucosamine transferase
MSGAPVLVMAGGTGGHIFPGIAVARELTARGVPVVWLGSTHGLENTLVPQAGITLERIAVSGLRGKGIVALLAAPFRVMRALAAALSVLRRVRPRAALALGGYAAGPGGLMARFVGVPLVVHEQNSVAGLTNRLLARVARRVLCGFPGALPGARSEVVGNPVRAEIAALPMPAARYAGRSGPLSVLVIGGSQGARALNRAMPAALARLGAGAGAVRVRHQCGKALQDEAREAYRTQSVDAEILPFIDDMAAAYAAADVIVCRAGALTLAELCAAGCASVLVPLPTAVDDHQRRNAMHLVEHGAAILIDESPVLADEIANALARLAADRGLLLGMAEAARRLAAPDATARIADAVLAEARA